MFGIQWHVLGPRGSAHPLADPARAAQLIAELPVETPASAVGEAAAWLESIEAEGFVPSHRYTLVAMIDEAVRPSVDELTLGYLGAAPGNPAQASDWRVLIDYLDRIAAVYAGIIDGCSERRNADLLPRVPLMLARTMRALGLSMKVSWLRYLPPDRSSWEHLVRAFRIARARGAATTLVTPYASDSEPTCALHELATAAMFAAAAPQSLTPRQVEVAYRIATAHRALFTARTEPDPEGRHYLLDLDNPGAPARLPDQTPVSADAMFFGAEAVVETLRAAVERSQTGGAASDSPYGREFGQSETQHVLAHVLRFWDNPPARRHERRRVNTKIHVEIGAKAIRSALDRTAQPAEPDNDLCMLDIAVEKPRTESDSAVTPLNTWTLTDFSTRGIGARFSRRLDRWLKVGSLIGFKLERSEKWCIAIVRRLRTDSRNQTDVGCEILAKNATLVTLEGLASAGTLQQVDGAGPLVHFSAVMLPHDPQLHSRSSLLFEPGTNAPGQSFLLHDGPTAKRVRLHGVSETLDGWDRVEFDVLE